MVSPELGEEILDLHESIDALAEKDPDKAEILELHYFGGLMVDDIAAVLEITQGAVAWDLRMAKAWLRRELSAD